MSSQVRGDGVASATTATRQGYLRVIFEPLFPFGPNNEVQSPRLSWGNSDTLNTIHAGQTRHELIPPQTVATVLLSPRREEGGKLGGGCCFGGWQYCPTRNRHHRQNFRHPVPHPVAAPLEVAADPRVGGEVVTPRQEPLVRLRPPLNDPRKLSHE